MWVGSFGSTPSIAISTGNGSTSFIQTRCGGCLLSVTLSARKLRDRPGFQGQSRLRTPPGPPSSHTELACAVGNGTRLRGAQKLKILVTCFPKSGSTFLSTLIGNLPGFSSVLYTPAYGRREQELSEAEIEHSCRISRQQVAQVHVRASEYTLDIIDKYSIRPIVLVRDIYDTAVSLAEHVANEPIMPMAYFDESIAARSFEDRLSAVVDLAMPWYFNFYVSWRRARPNAIVTYEDLILGDAERQTKYFNSIGLATNIADVRSAIEKVRSLDTRFNVGKSGRGIRAIGTRHRRQIERLASYYPDEDFSHIGIGRMIGNETVQSAWEVVKAGASHLVRRF
jgi:hypothetical protein